MFARRGCALRTDARDGLLPLNHESVSGKIKERNYPRIAESN